MSRLLLLCAFCIFSCTDILGQPAGSANADFGFVGVVTKVVASPVEGSIEDWVVSTKVETIETGDFSGGTFSFRIHSPARARLVVGKRYHFHATKTDSGYTVSEFQIKEA